MVYQADEKVVSIVIVSEAMNLGFIQISTLRDSS